MGLKVWAATADGASTNRRLMKIHHNRGDDMTHKVINPYVTRFGEIHLNAVKLIIRYDHLLSLN